MSTTDPAAASGGTGALGNSTGTTAASSPGVTPTGSGSTGPTGGSTNVVINLQPFISDAAWLADLVLDRLKSNWEQWNWRLNLVIDQRHFLFYLDGTFLCPNEMAHPKAALNWKSNNWALCMFILEHVSNVDFGIASRFNVSHEVYDALCNTHKNLGLHAQVHIIKEALDLCFSLTSPLNLSHTLDNINHLHDRFTKMGKMDDDKLKIILIINTLEQFPQSQSTINELLESSPSISSADIKNRILREEQLLLHREKLGLSLTSSGSNNTALATVANRTRPICANCKCTNHHSEFCIAPGGSMARKTIDKAHAAQRVAAGKLQSCSNRNNPTFQSANTAQASASITEPVKASNLVTFNGKSYMLVLDNTTTQPAQLATSSANTVLTATLDQGGYQPIMLADYDQEEYLAMFATNGDSHTSINWDTNRQLVNPTTVPTTAYHAGCRNITCVTDLPFILDTGATCHISPEASNFKVLKSIPCHPVKGLGGSAVYAISVSDIELCITSSHKLKLSNVLYIPESNVHLISILTLNKSGDYTTHFDSMTCWVTNKSNTMLMCRSLSLTKCLYILMTKTPFVQHAKMPEPFILYMRVPDLETWHRRLSHCNPCTIMEIAKKGASEGMPIDLSSLPAKCDHCMLRKQLQSPVPKTWEGSKAERRLERVFMDLCGPMAVASHSGNIYSMNLIDDFSGYMWSIPLQSKSKACEAIQVWHKAVTTQTGDKLQILITDNGELVSTKVCDWCNAEGINHQLTAPYMLAHNGRAECLHRTLLRKACTMRLTCNAPAFLLDEFCSTAAYLTTLTAATANNGKTPYKLWFSRKPSLSHLKEIGCCAFVLHTPALSKIYQRSAPCILIRYAPHSKAYQLWDPTSSCIFNSFHISFTEHLDLEPSPLFPGTVLGTAPPTSPPSWDCPSRVPVQTDSVTRTPFSVIMQIPSPISESEYTSPYHTVTPSLSTVVTRPANSMTNTVKWNTATSSTVNSNTATSSTVTPNTITPNTITPNTITPNTITPNTITPNTITPNTITPNTITPNTTNPNTITPHTT